MSRTLVAVLCLLLGVGIGAGSIFIHMFGESKNQGEISADLLESDLVLRRQTLIVRDINKSLALYRDAIGMEVIYDQVITREVEGKSKPQILRLILLKATDDFVGVLGLVDYEYGYPDHHSHKKPISYEGFTPSNSVLIFNTTKLDETWKKISATPDISVLSAPKLTVYPGYKEGSEVRVMVSKFYDPDGFLVEINQLLDPISR